MGQNGKKVIGKIEYYSACGSSSYVSYFYDEESYLKAIHGYFLYRCYFSLTQQRKVAKETTTPRIINSCPYTL